MTQGNCFLIGSKKLRAASRPAFAPWSACTEKEESAYMRAERAEKMGIYSPDSGAKRIVAPLLPPVLDSLSYVPELCQASLTSTGA